MVSQAEIRPRSVLLSLSTLSKMALELIDFASVATCLWIITALLQLTFAKDLLEIVEFAAVVCFRRLAWCLRLLGFSTCSESPPQEADPLPQPDTPPPRISVTCVEQVNPGTSNFSPVSTPPSSSYRMFLLPSRVDACVSSPVSNRDVVHVSPLQQPSPKRWWQVSKPSRDDFAQKRDAYLSSIDHFRRLESKLNEVISQNKNEDGATTPDRSPEVLGCCNGLIHHLKLRHAPQKPSFTMHYERF